MRFMNVLTVAGLVLVAGRAAQALPQSITLTHPDPSIGSYAKLDISRVEYSPGLWRWTYVLDNLKDASPNNPSDPYDVIPIHHFAVGINMAAFSDDWQDHIIKVYDTDHDLNQAGLEGKPGELKSEKILWDWDASGTGDDFVAGKMTFVFDTDLDFITQASHLAGDGLGDGTNTGATPAPTPEPATMALLGMGGAGMLAKLRRRRRQDA
jgi:hypothetical protein